jgi:hypothetical protein
MRERRWAVHYLVDGYNLLFTLGYVRKTAGQREFEQARERLIAYLTGKHAERPGHATVVFDAVRATRFTQSEQHHGRLSVRYALKQQADDLIEVLIRQEAAPHKLTVVSNDQRLREAARRRRCVGWTLPDYVDWLERTTLPMPATPTVGEGKPARVSDAELNAWLTEFGEIETDDVRTILRYPKAWDDVRGIDGPL